MRTGKPFLLHLFILLMVLMLACEYEDVPSAAATAKPEYTGTFEVKATLAQTISDGALSYTLTANVPFKIAWSEDNQLWKITGEDQNAQGSVALTGSIVNCTGALTGQVEISGYVYPEQLKPCLMKFSVFQNWSSATLTCVYTFPTTYTQEIPNGSAAFSISDDFTYSATSGYHSKPVSYTSGILTGLLQLKMKSFSGTLIDGCGVTY